MSRPLNGYALTNHFRQLRSRWAFTHLEAHLFLELMALCNDARWPVEFSAKNNTLTAALGCSEPGLIKARKKLAEAGLLTYTMGQNRRPTAYRFCTPKGLTEFSDSATEDLTEGLTEFSDSAINEGKHLTEDLTEGLTEFSPYKEQTKTKRKDSSKLKNELPQNEIAFNEFWGAYGKKVGKHKAEQRWQTLTPTEQAAALAHAPRYAAATPNKQFRKDPLTYLNGKCWLDEELPAYCASQSTSPPAAPSAPFNPDDLFGYTQPASEGLALARSGPDWDRYQAEEAAKAAEEAAKAAGQADTQPANPSDSSQQLT